MCYLFYSFICSFLGDVIINVMSVQEVLAKFYPFIPLLVTLALLQSHSDMGMLTQ